MLKFDETKAGKDAPESLRLTNIAITSNFQETDSPYRHIPDAISEQMRDLHTQALKGNVQIIKKLEKLIEKYPRVPVLYNYLSLAYMQHKNFKKGEQINESMLKRFPDYSLGRINQAVLHIIRSEFDKAEEYLGQTMEISDFLPDRKVYHISEVCQFYEMTVRFFIRKRDFKVADSHLAFLKDISAKFDDFHKEKIKQLEDEKEKELEEIREETYESCCAC